MKRTDHHGFPVRGRRARGRFWLAGMGLVLGGTASAAGCVSVIVRFMVRNMPITREFSLEELLRGIVVPQLLLLTCVAVVVYGVGLIRRSADLGAVQDASRRAK